MKKSDTGKSRDGKPHDAEKLSESPLKTMGINNPAEISRYTLRQEDNEDVLRVYYKRRKGSLLPASRKYKFGRAHKTIITNSGAPEYAEDSEISPILQAAIAELNEIVKLSDDAAEQKKAIVDEIEHLEKYLCAKVKDLRTQIERL